MATDCISRDDLLERLGIDDLDCTKCSWGDRHGFVCKRGCDFQDACEAIEDAEPADVVEQKRGSWLTGLVKGSDGGIIKTFVFCSVCNMLSEKETNYCSCCGAKMGGEP